MKKSKLIAIFLISVFLFTILGASITAKADAIIKLGVYVRKEGTEKPINPSKVSVWYTRLFVPNPEEKPAMYVPERQCWLACAWIKDPNERASFKIRVKVGNTEKVEEIYDLKDDPNIEWYKTYFYFNVQIQPISRSPLIFNLLEKFLEKSAWSFPMLRLLAMIN
jgi:hypothetical protein